MGLSSSLLYGLVSPQRSRVTDCILFISSGGHCTPASSQIPGKHSGAAYLKYHTSHLTRSFAALGYLMQEISGYGPDLAKGGHCLTRFMLSCTDDKAINSYYMF